MRDILRDVVKQRFDGKADVPDAWGGFLGNPQCVVAVPGRPNYVYVTMGDGTVVEAYNKVAPTILNLPVTLGFDPSQEKANLLEVLSVRNIPRYAASENAYYHVDAHHVSHEWMNYNGNTDVVYMQLRQFMPLRPTLVAHTDSTPFQVYIQPAMQLISGNWMQVGGSTVSLLNYGTNPQTVISGSGAHAKYVLISMSAVTGSLVISSGSTKTMGTLALSDIPATPANHIPICAVRRYDLQPKILESRLTTDLVDLRWGMPLNGLVLPATTSPPAGYYLTGYNAASGSFSSGSPVLPLSATPGTGFFLNGYNAASGSFSSGSVASNHNTLVGLQGGQANEYYHLTAAEHTIVTQASGSASDGYLTSADWQRFNATSGSGVSQLSQLTDVSIGGQTNGQVLMWNSGSSKWVPGTSAGSGDVSGPASATDGHVALFDGATGKLIKDGGEYVANPITLSGSVVAGHNAIFTDASGSTIQDGGFINYSPDRAPASSSLLGSYSDEFTSPTLNAKWGLITSSTQHDGAWSPISGSIVYSCTKFPGFFVCRADSTNVNGIKQSFAPADGVEFAIVAKVCGSTGFTNDQRITFTIGRTEPTNDEPDNSALFQWGGASSYYCRLYYKNSGTYTTKETFGVVTYPQVPLYLMIARNTSNVLYFLFSYDGKSWIRLTNSLSGINACTSIAWFGLCCVAQSARTQNTMNIDFIRVFNSITDTIGS